MGAAWLRTKSEFHSVVNYKKYNFQQDVVTSHTEKRVQEWFQGKMADKSLNKKMWPRSPDLNPAEFCLKRVVYDPMPKTLEDLMENIKRVINKIPESVLKNVFENFEKRCHFLVTAEGGHIEKIF